MGNAEIADPAAPRVVVNVPSDWTSAPGQGAVALALSGPDGMSGSVTIAATTDGPAEAFTQYSDDVTAMFPLSSINVAPAEFCGYSSQKLFGSVSDEAGQSLDFADRITHIWTNTGEYLVVIHAQAPVRTAGFESAKSVLMEDFAVVIP